MREDLIDDDAPESAADTVSPARRATHRFAGRPGPWIGFTVARSRHYERVTRSIRRRRIRRITAIVHLEQNCVAVITKSQSARAVLQAVRPKKWTVNICEAVTAPKIGRVGSYHKIAFGCKNRVRRKHVVDRSGNAPASQFFNPRLRIIDFDKLEISAVGAIRRMIHDF